VKKSPFRIIALVAVAAGMIFGARPFSTDDAGIVSPAGYEFEAGIDYRDASGALTLGFKHGLTGKMDLGVGFGYVALNPDEISNRFQPAEICLKYSFLPDLLAASMTFGFEANAYALNGILSRSRGKLSFNANLGAEASVPTVTYGVGLVYEVTGRLSAGVEAAGDRDGFNAWLVGGGYAAANWLTIDAGFAGDFDLGSKSLTFGIHNEF